MKLICSALLKESPDAHAASLNDMKVSLTTLEKSRDVSSALVYLRDRVGVPRDLPLAAARQLRAHLNEAIEVLHNLDS